MKNQRTEPQSFYDLIDRLQAVSTINHPQRPWGNDFYYSCAMAWIGKEEELRQRVEMLEARLPKESETAEQYRIRRMAEEGITEQDIYGTDPHR